jgi:hypothetical protein
MAGAPPIALSAAGASAPIEIMTTTRLVFLSQHNKYLKVENPNLPRRYKYYVEQREDL